MRLETALLTSLLLITAGGILFADRTMWAELIVLATIAGFLAACPIIARHAERNTT